MLRYLYILTFFFTKKLPDHLHFKRTKIQNVRKLNQDNTFSFKTRFLNYASDLRVRAEHLHLFKQLELLYLSLLANSYFGMRNMWNQELVFIDILHKKKSGVITLTRIFIQLIHSTNIENPTISKILNTYIYENSPSL